MESNEVAEVLNRPTSQELLARKVIQLAYIATDGTPRCVPIDFTWNGSEVVMCTATNAPKVASLRQNPTVALTVDVEVSPPKVLIMRGTAELDAVAGLPDEYLHTSGADQMAPEQRSRWEADMRSLYDDGMVRVVVTPTWAKLIDFETTFPSPVDVRLRRRDRRADA